ncbi:MAG: FG-GAP-like repeat-containing protein [Verrucomicrobia bacterium]|nr:FG-GAP-like repeat-containing protein [Verrucomicrobiota bacterium]
MKTHRWQLIVQLAAFLAWGGAADFLHAATPRLFPDLTFRYPVGDTNAHNPLEGTEGPKVLASGDLNGDGLADVVSGNLDGSVSVLLGRPNGTLGDQILAPATNLLASSSIRAVVVADFDHDGKPDVVVGDIAHQGVVVLLGNGDGTLRPFGRTFIGPVRALAAADLNEDGKVDLVVACGPPDCDQCPIETLPNPANRFLCVLLGNGDGTFQAPRYLLSPGVVACFYQVAAADLDQDGHLDVLVLDLQKRIQIFINDGLANFTADAPQQVLIPSGAGPRAFSLGYLDETVTNNATPPAGATLDIVVANRDSSSLDIFLNRGGLIFDPPTTLHAGDSPRGVAVGDLDGDGLADLVVVNRNVNTISVLRGLGGGHFDLPTVEWPAGASPREVVLADFNGDGLLDAAVNNRVSEDISLFQGTRGTAGFLISDAFYPAGVTPVSVVAMDFNGDGLPDLATANLRSHDVRIRLNQGGGVFGPETIYPVNFGPAFLAAGDVNGDGHIDLVVSCLGSSVDAGTNYAPALVTLLGRGNGAFQPPVASPLGPHYVRPFVLRLGDLSGDGKLDVAVGGVDGSLLVFRGKGDGTFEPGIPTGLKADGRPLGLALGDFDHNGKLDIATSRGLVFLNDGQFFSGASFTNGVWSGRTSLFNSGEQAWAVEAVDLDDDGNLDLIVALTFERPDPIAIFFGNGHGSFLAPKIYEGPDVGAVALWGADMDGDGIKDVVIGNRCAATVIILQGLGNREFTLQEIVRTCSVESLAVADLNGDGKPDLVGVGFGLWPILNGDTNRLIVPRTAQNSGLAEREGLFINEIMALNQQFLVVGKFTPDWVEIYNNSATNQSLAAWSLANISSDGQSTNSWNFPSTTLIEPWGHLLVYCKKKSGGLSPCASFELSSDGETVVLVRPGGIEEDRVRFPAMPADVSYARFSDGARFFSCNPAPTPGSANLRPANLDPTVDRKDPYVGPGASSLGLNARVFDDVAIAYVSVVFREAGSTNARLEIPLSDDGLQGDKLPGDGYYGAILPPLAPGAILEYFFRVIDLEGQIVTSPANHDDPAGLHRITVPAPMPALRLSELVADNNTGLCDEFGEHEDWLEIVNTGDTPQRLDDLVLLKDYYDQTNAWHFLPHFALDPGESCIVFCDDQPFQGPLHANFKLSRDGDRVFLIRADTNWTIIDSLSYGPLPTDTSFGILGNGTVAQLLFWPTPGAPNRALPPLPPDGTGVELIWQLLSGPDSTPTLAVRWMGHLNCSCHAEWSTDLVTWYQSTNPPIPLGQGVYQWGDSATAVPQRFYRIVEAWGNPPSEITRQPIAQQAWAGGSATFSVSVQSDLPLTCQWRKDGTDLVDDGRIFGTVSDHLTIVNVQASDAGLYRVVVNNAYGTVLSSSARLGVVAGVATVAVFDDRRYVDTTSGGAGAESDNVQASLTNRGFTVVTFTNMVAATAANSVLLFPEQEVAALAPALSLAEQSALSGFVAGGGLMIVHGSFTTSRSADLLNQVFGLAVQEAPASNGLVFSRTTQAAGTVFVNAPASLAGQYASDILQTASLPPGARSIYATNGQSVVAEIDYGNGKIIFLGWDWSGAAPIGTQDGGWLAVLESAVREGRPVGLHPPVIFTQPASQTGQPGKNVTFRVAASGLLPLGYQWHKDGLALKDGENISGATTAALTVSNLFGDDAGGYRVVITNEEGSVTSTVAVLTMNLAALDNGFNPGANNAVYSLAAQADGKVLVGGMFSTLGGQPCNRIGRLNGDGTVDSGFNPGANVHVSSFLVQDDGSIVVGGAFTTLGGQPRANIARLNGDGSLDSGFNPGASSTVFALAAQTNGQIVVGGFFTTLGGQPRTNLARLNGDGTVDSGFKPAANGTVYSLALQADGKLLLGGVFTAVAGQPRTNIARLNGDGTLDSAFNPGAGNRVCSLVVQADGKILVGGYFTNLAGQPCNYLGRLRDDGTLDGAFNPGVGGGSSPYVSSLAMQADGKILVGGAFTNVAGKPHNYLARLNTDGTLDDTFKPDADNTVFAVSVQPDGMVLVGGAFTNLAGQPRGNLARLINTEPAAQSLLYDGWRVTWLRGGTGPEVWRTTFDQSPDGLNWASLGAGTRVPGGWQLGGVLLPPGGTIRARGYVTGGRYNASAWFVETLFQPAWR